MDICSHQIWTCQQPGKQVHTVGHQRAHIHSTVNLLQGLLADVSSGITLLANVVSGITLLADVVSGITLLAVVLSDTAWPAFIIPGTCVAELHGFAKQSCQRAHRLLH